MTRVIRLLAGDSEWPWYRQTPYADGRFGDTLFVFGPVARPEITDEDLIVVYESLPSEWKRLVDPARCLFICGEPPSVKKYPTEFLLQFGAVISVDPGAMHPHLMTTQPGLPWHVGMRIARPDTYGDALVFQDFLEEPKKSKLCSVICSDKAMTPEHRRRINFVDLLMSRLGDRVDRFGRGTRPVADKDEALADYRFHIALENCSIPNYWTEKLADPLLRNCYPIYWGATNAADYFPTDSMAAIDISHPDDAVQKIEAILATDVDLDHREALREAKRRVMWQHNIFALLDEFDGARSSRPKVILKPETEYAPGLVARAVNRLRRLTHRMVS